MNFDELDKMLQVGTGLGNSFDMSSVSAALPTGQPTGGFSGGSSVYDLGNTYDALGALTSVEPLYPEGKKLWSDCRTKRRGNQTTLACYNDKLDKLSKKNNLEARKYINNKGFNAVSYGEGVQEGLRRDGAHRPRPERSPGGQDPC